MLKRYPVKKPGERWPGEANGLPKPGTPEWKAFHQRNRAIGLKDKIERKARHAQRQIPPEQGNPDTEPPRS